MDLLLALLIGIASSGIVAYLVYRRQRSDAAVSEQRLAFLMEKALRATQGAAEALHTTVAMLDLQHRASQEELDQIRESFAIGLQALSRDLRQPRTRGLKRSLRLSLSDLTDLHRQLMPAKTAFAGTLRNTQVRIAGTAHNPPHPEAISGLLESLLSAWNTVADRIHLMTRAEQIHELAKFHHSLVSIHPFSDGNGALARAILSRQLRALLGVTRPLVFADRGRYFEALQAADSGDLGALERIIVEFASAA